MNPALETVCNPCSREQLISELSTFHFAKMVHVSNMSFGGTGRPWVMGCIARGMVGEAPTEEEFWADGFLYFPTKPCWPNSRQFLRDCVRELFSQAPLEFSTKRSDMKQIASVWSALALAKVICQGKPCSTAQEMQISVIQSIMGFLPHAPAQAHAPPATRFQNTETVATSTCFVGQYFNNPCWRLISHSRF